MNYHIPSQFHFPLHHPRPRFKRDVENVLVYVATHISRLPRMQRSQFMDLVNQDIRMFPGNAVVKQKTIDNWRTEISSLLALIEYDSESDECWPGQTARLLADNQDLMQFFRYFLFSFQYPGGHLKPQESLHMISYGIKFKPAQYILAFLEYAEEKTTKRFGISKSEATHCIFNDLRVTKDSRQYEDVLRLILNNRETGLGYDSRGDVIRTAGDILDYMVLAKLLVLRGNSCFINPLESEVISTFINSTRYFQGYDHLYGSIGASVSDVRAVNDDWFAYVNELASPETFKTDIMNYFLELEEQEEAKLPEPIRQYVERARREGIDTKAIGNMGENLVHGHECMKIKIAGRDDLIHLIRQIPDHLGVGYDILSVESDERKRYVEVKTTISDQSIRFNQFHLTTNEWVVAESLAASYFVYRLSVSREGTRLFLIQNPVGKYKNDLLRMVPRDGADIGFTDKSGTYEELLAWER